MTIQFPDVSNHQGRMSIAGAVACIAKATEGMTFRDATFTHYRDQALAMGIPFAGYHWIHKTDVAAQARNAYAVVGPNIPLMIDDEDPNDGFDINRTLAFVNEYRVLGGTVTLEYLPRWFWRNYGSPDLTPLVKAGLSLISSSYTTYSDGGVGWQPYGGMTPAIWQYTSSASWNGVANVDFNAFKGTVEQLRALFAGKTLPPSRVEDDDMWTTTGPSGTVYLVPGDLKDGKPVAIPRTDFNEVKSWWANGMRSVSSTVEPKAPYWFVTAPNAPWPPAGSSGGPTHDELVQAAFEGAQRAEDE